MPDPDNGVVYRNAPIVEAIISLTVVFKDGGADRAAAGVEKAFESRFARRQSQDRLNFQVESHPAQEPKTSLSRRQSGLKFSDEKNERVLQVLADTFVYSHLQPYTNWRTFSAEAIELWQTYLKVAEPALVRRIGLRYINRLRLPGGQFELSDYLSYFPLTPTAFGTLSGLVSQVQLPQGGGAAPDAVALVTVASEPSQESGTSAMALDIDISSKLSVRADDPIVWRALDEFRVRKNRIFEAAITEKLKEAIR